MRHLSLTLTAVAITLIALAGCSSSSSGAGPTSAAHTPKPSATPIDRQSVDAVLNDVLIGLRSGAAVSKHATLTTAAAAIRKASDKLAAASSGLSPVPSGVPDPIATPVIANLNRISGLLGTAATCLTAQASAKAPSTTRCLPPLRKAQAHDADLAHELIDLAAYGTRSPKVYESLLVDALQGR